ncbi:ArsA family ATPase [Synechocystis sp. LKSZ1]|uniref:Get3/ArsA fold putative tail anchor-mediating ATPase NosAFP n=1 Tax=Synechocystis sp. LKSZ1 TaxID=3144951 RepID=UPI00336C15E8
MASILTFLGKGGTGRSITAIAVAKSLAQKGKRVLLLGQDPSLGFYLGTPLHEQPREVETNFFALNLTTTALLERGWEQVKELESQYLRSPTLKNIYGQELGVLPGMDEILILNALREYDQSNRYDVILYDGPGNLNTLRMLGVAEIASWYWRRFRQVLDGSEVIKTVSPFLQPVAGALLNGAWNLEELTQNPQGLNNLLETGKTFLADPRRFAAYLVTTPAPVAVLGAKALWGGAQQVGLTVKGVLVTPGQGQINQEFPPLPMTALATFQGDNWPELVQSLPDLLAETTAPRPLDIDLTARQVKVFLPGFDKKQVKLTQYGPEITIEAGDQRRNIDLPAPLRGQAVTGAKFQDHYLIISF